MKLKILLQKSKKKIWNILVFKLRYKQFYYFIYRSYWHTILFKNIAQKEKNYYSAIPNPGAGIGHQLANWIAGYWWAHYFNLEFAHIPFSNYRWEDFLGFGKDEITVEELVKNKGYRKVNLPLFHFDNKKEVLRTEEIINSYSNQKVVFIAEQDQPYFEQFGVMDQIKRKFHENNVRQKDKFIYSKENFNIAVHVRRGDIELGLKNNNPNLLLRWQDNNYFYNVLQSVIQIIKTDKPLAIYLFTQGNQQDFPEFNKFNNIRFCNDMNAQDSFLHMVFADLLITSKSSFSYKPALLSNGIKVCPKNFWHGYPDKSDWVLAEENGTLEHESVEKLKSIF
jgi:hypothetical protein